MKKQIRLDDGETIIAEVDDAETRKAVMLLFSKTDTDLVLLVEPSKKPKVFLLVGYNEKTKLLEYQLSDGMDCYRHYSFNYYNLKDAVKAFHDVCENGWGILKKTLKKNPLTPYWKYDILIQ